jgi:hypothetical protein
MVGAVHSRFGILILRQRTLNHNVCGCLQVWLVLELCTGGSLKDAVTCGRIRTSSCQDMVSGSVACAAQGCLLSVGCSMRTQFVRACRAFLHLQ